MFLHWEFSEYIVEIILTKFKIRLKTSQSVFTRILMSVYT